MTHKGGGPDIDKDEIKEALDSLAQRTETEKLLSVRLDKCMISIKEILDAIGAAVGSSKMWTVANKGYLTTQVGERILNISPAVGVALDGRLPHPRGLYCAQILFFAHTGNQPQSKLIASFRVYPDGMCTDGSDTWKCDDDDKTFVEHVTRLVTDALFHCDLYWPAPEEMPEFIRSVPVMDEGIDEKELQHSCIGFECTLPARPPA